MSGETDNSNDNDNGGDDNGDEGKGAESKPIVFKSQEELDALIGGIVAKRLRKFADYDELAQKAKAVDEANQAKMSAEERAQAAAKDAAEKATAATERLRKANLRSEVAYYAAEANAADIDTVLALVKDRVEFDQEDNPLEVKDLIAKILKEKPFLIKSEGKFTTSADGGARNTPDRSKQTMDEVMASRPAGRNSRF